MARDKLAEHERRAKVSEIREMVIENVRCIMYKDDALEHLVPSDLRSLVGAIDDLKKQVGATLMTDDRAVLKEAALMMAIDAIERGDEESGALAIKLTKMARRVDSL